MGRSSADEITSLKESLLEKNRLIEQQMSIINQQLEVLPQIVELKKQVQLYETTIREVEEENNRRIRELMAEIARLKQFVLKVREHPFIRLMRWFKDEN